MDGIPLRASNPDFVLCKVDARTRRKPLILAKQRSAHEPTFAEKAGEA